ncbi:MAG: hypothetical protein NC548_44630 [Lachnospiraceae bacterium]|nr:hypothetical protein [Lachnospiraceae bacterium]
MKNKMIDLHNALFAELETLQDMDSFCDEDGKLDREKAELAIKRADAVNDVAGKIMELVRIQIDAVKTANSMGVAIRLPETLGIEEIPRAGDYPSSRAARR